MDCGVNRIDDLLEFSPSSVVFKSACNLLRIFAEVRLRYRLCMLDSQGVMVHLTVRKSSLCQALQEQASDTSGGERTRAIKDPLLFFLL